MADQGVIRRCAYKHCGRDYVEDSIEARDGCCSTQCWATMNDRSKPVPITEQEYRIRYREKGQAWLEGNWLVESRFLPAKGKAGWGKRGPGNGSCAEAVVALLRILRESTRPPETHDSIIRAAARAGGCYSNLPAALREVPLGARIKVGHPCPECTLPLALEDVAEHGTAGDKSEFFHNPDEERLTAAGMEPVCSYALHDDPDCWTPKG